MDELKQAFRKMAKAWHPDFFHDDPEFKQVAEERLRQIISAYRALTSQYQLSEFGNQKQEKTVKNYRRCSDPNCSGIIGPDLRCSLCMKKHRRKPNGNGRANSGTVAREYKLHLCSVCGRFNKVLQQFNARRYLCWNCRNPLDWAGAIKALGPGPSLRKTHRFLGFEFSNPSLDYLKFLSFCVFFLGLVVVTCFGAAMLIWSGVNLIVPYYLKYFH